MLSSKIESTIKDFIKNYKDLYNFIINTTNSTMTKDYNNDEVPYVSQLVSLIILFFKEFTEFKDLTKNYSTIEEFNYQIFLYHRIRNDLSHPGSKKILKNDASSVIKLLIKFMEVIDDKFFWFVSKNKINSTISLYYKQEKSKILKYDNLKNMNVSHQKTICRETELNFLHKCILGETEYSRVAGSIVIYGYGGVGKTALVVDFIYEIIQKMQSENNDSLYDFIFFFSTKEEMLTTSNTTGEFYIDKINVDIHSYDDIENQILNLLSFKELAQLQRTTLKGLIVIDNIENISEIEKEKIFTLMQNIPRSIQFIMTSRSEEKSEQKLHLSEFRDFEQGKKFIINYIINNNLALSLNDNDIQVLLSTTKGNTLLLVQSLFSLNDKTKTIHEISEDLNNYESSSFEKVASFMYKNTFDYAIQELDKKNLNPTKIILIATLYKEKIDLYALSVLSEIPINDVRDIANYLTSKLIFNKNHEFYLVNEFAARFIFISLMPNNREKQNLENNISKYKNTLNIKLKELDNQMQSNEKINRIITDWKPNSYIDKIVIADAFQMYNKFVAAILKRNNFLIDNLFKEYERLEYNTKHPYVRFQKARILNKMLILKYYGTKKREERILEIKRYYEDTIDSINTSYSYIKNTESHIAVLMFFGIFLNRNIPDYPKAIRYLEDAKDLVKRGNIKNHFLILKELSSLYLTMYESTKDKFYYEEFEKTHHTITNSIKNIDFNIDKYKKEINVKLKSIRK